MRNATGCLVAFLTLALAGCGRSEEPSAPSETGQTPRLAVYGARGQEVLARDVTLTMAPDGAVQLTRPVGHLDEADSPLPLGLLQLPGGPGLLPGAASLPAPGAVAPGVAPDAATLHEELRLSPDASGAHVLRLAGRAPLIVREEGAHGAIERLEGAASYAREGGRSYWTLADGHGFEEWLELEAGRAYADRAAAYWRVEGARLREVSATGGVHVLGADGQPVAYVSAPRAFDAAGAAVRARLAVEGDRIALFVDANGAAVLVDPMWVATGSLIQARREFYQGNGAMLLADGRVLIAGGYNDSVGYLASAETYSPTTGVWSSTASMGGIRAYHGTTMLPSGRALVSAGNNGAGPIATAQLYDPTTNTWSSAASLIAARYFHTSTLLSSGNVLVTGGYNGGSLASAEIYDPTTNTWSSAASMSTRRYGHTATLLASGRVLVTGGSDTNGAPYVSSAELYDPATNTWSSASGLSVGRIFHTATRLSTGRVLAAGGFGGGYNASADLYDPATNSWSAAASMSTPHYGHTAALTSSGLVVAGGYDGSAYTGSTEIYDAVANSWSSGGAMTSGHTYAAEVVLADGRPMVAGGYSASGVTAVTDIYGGATAVCGNGTVEAGEGCDDGNTNAGDCCSPTCQLESAATVCRGSVGGCDAAENCTGTTPSCPADAAQPAGTACGGAPSGACDVQDTCSGAVGATAVCQSLFASSATSCRASVGACDASENCTGSSALCPADAAQPAGTACGGAPSGACDVQDTCAGTVGATAICRSLFASSATSCRGSVGACDVAENCTGSAPLCPADAAQPAGTPCGGAPTDVCDTQDRCAGPVGATAICQSLFVPATMVCRPSAGDCDAAEACTGSSVSCPTNVFMPFPTVCRASAGTCDSTEYCSGSAPDCPSNSVMPLGTLCRPAAGPCDAAESCNGFATCPPDAARPDGASCSDGLVCDGAEACRAGVCATGIPPACSDANLCTTDACREPGGCHSTPVAGCCNLDSECADDGNVCTSERCSGPGGACQSLPIASCCRVDADCSAGGACVTVRCDTATNRCASAPIAGCCTSDSQCSDGLACTTDACSASHGCTSTARAGCCTGNADCHDTDACTADACNLTGLTGTCVAPVIPNCCTSDATCHDTDGNACTTPSCNTTTQRCAETMVHCDDANLCTVDACQTDGTCSHTPLDCGDGDACTADACAADGTCSHARIAGCGDAGMGDAGTTGSDAGMTGSDGGMTGSDAGMAGDGAVARDSGMRADAASDASGGDAARAADAGPPTASTGCGCSVPRRSSDHDARMLGALALLWVAIRRGRRR